jgi:hypothetical protein
MQCSPAIGPPCNWTFSCGAWHRTMSSLGPYLATLAEFELVGLLSYGPTIGTNGSSWLSNAVFGSLANVLQTSYRRQTRVFARTDPTYAITDACVLLDTLGTCPVRARRSACFWRDAGLVG